MSYILKRMYAASSYASEYNGYGFKKLKTYYSITRNLELCHSSSAVTSAEANMPYTETITAEEYSTFTGATISVTMGGVDITATAYSNGVITIPMVTGDIVIIIRAVATVPILYTPNADYTAYAVLWSKQTLKYAVLWAPTGRYFRIYYEQVVNTKRLTTYLFADERYSGASTAYPMYVSVWYDTEEEAYAAIKNPNTQYTYHDNTYKQEYLTSVYIGNSSGQTNYGYAPCVKLKTGGSYFTTWADNNMPNGYSQNYTSPIKFSNDEVILTQS